MGKISRFRQSLKPRRNFQYYSVLVLIVLFITALQGLGFFNELQNLIYDKFFVSRKPAEQILIAAIDDESLNAIGAWPWDREVFAKILNNLNTAGVRVVSFDVVFGEERSGDAKFSEALKNSKSQVVLAGKLTEEDGFFSPIPSLVIDGKSNAAFVNFDADSDGKIRLAQLLAEVNSECRMSLALRSVKLYVNSLGGEDCNSEGLSVGFSKFNLENGRIRINYAGAAGTFPRIPLADIYNNNFDPALVKDKIVLIGSTIQDFKSDLQDNLANPFDGQVIPGVEMHANVINTILQNDFIYPVAPAWNIIAVILASFISYALSRKLQILLSGVLLVVLVILFGLTASLLWGLGWIVNVMAVPLVLITVWVVENLWQYYLKRKENLELKKAFGQYVNSHLLNQILKDPEKLKLGGVNKVLSVLFSDIRGFTSISEKVQVEKLVNYLNIYLTKVTKVILDQDGVVDKYIGDAVMAIWGAPLDNPLHSYNSCKAALAMLVAVNEFNDSYGNDFPEIKIGIGINSGNMIAGNMGSELRFDYTVLGDNVNLGSRLEGLTKQYGIMIMLGENVIAHLKEIGKFGEFEIREIDNITVKGKAESVRVYELMQPAETSKELIAAYEKALNLYYKSKFAEAEKQFVRIYNKYGDKASDAMAARCAQFIAEPDSAFKGVWSWTTK